jgi:hypothetical protein
MVGGAIEYKFIVGHHFVFQLKGWLLPILMKFFDAVLEGFHMLFS